MIIKLITLWKVSYEDSFWNRGTRIHSSTSCSQEPLIFIGPTKLLSFCRRAMRSSTATLFKESGHAKSALHLLKKLIPLVFSTEELGNSYGQGIGKGGKGNSEGKWPLVQQKVNACKSNESLQKSLSFLQPLMTAIIMNVFKELFKSFFP